MYMYTCTCACDEGRAPDHLFTCIFYSQVFINFAREQEEENV